MTRRTIRAVDLFCGAGGSSTGLAQAVERHGARLELLAVNHWTTAVETHAANHPWAEHRCASLDALDARKEVSGKLDLLVASPECTHHSSARGGKPMSDQSRASAWHVTAWAEQLRPRTILVENVREFQSWGPLDARGRPIKARAGETYDAWIQSLRSMGYRVEARVLNAADYGDATTRRRLFVVATLARRGPVFPTASHDRDGHEMPSLPLARWRSAREIIDWSFPSRSIFDRERPLAPATLRRIEEGLRRFGGAAAEPFLVVLRRNMAGRSLDDPLPTLTAGAEHVALCQPFTLSQQSGGIARPVSQPIQALATKGAVSLVEPFALQLTHGGRLHDVGSPLPTVTTAHRGEFGVVEPFLVPHYSERQGQRPRVHGLADPVPTIPATNQHALVEPFLVRYNGTGGAESTNAPVPTLTAKDRFALVETKDGPMAVDIRFRMLQPHELAAAMSFPKGYKFSGNRGDTVRQIGNAVPVRTAAALCETILSDLVKTQ